MIGQGLGRLALAEKMSVQQLEEALQNRTLPGYIALPLIEEKTMLEQRMQMAAAAGAQMPQNTIKDEILQDARQVTSGGIDQVEAMQPGVGIDQAPMAYAPEMAGGGIVAFDAGGSVEKTQEERDREAIMKYLRRAGAASMDVLTLPGRGIAGAVESGITRPLRAAGIDVPYLPASFYGGDASSMTPYYDQLRREEAAQTDTGAQAAPGASTAPVAPTTAAPKKEGTAKKADKSLVTDEVKDLLPTAGLSVEDFKKQQEAFGIKGDVDSDLRKQLSEMASQTKQDREQAKYRGLVRAGLKMMAGTDPNALKNITEGAIAGYESYEGDIKDVKGEERNLMKMNAELARAEDARKRGDFKTFQEASDKAKSLSLDMYQAQSGRMIAKAQQARASGAGGITRNQMATLRMRAEKEVDPDAIRGSVAKELKLSKVPAPGANKKFDQRVEAAYEEAIQKRVDRALGTSMGGGSMNFSGYKILEDEE